MHRCLQLARLGAGHTAPNPMVGAVLVYDDRIIGEGWHQRFGEAHAEVNCLNSVRAADQGLIAKSTLYVSLEPCAHHGKTPPCADLVIGKKIPRVVIGCKDSYKEVDGRGIDRLKAAGVEVEVGVLEKDCLELNKRFFCFHQWQRPYIILKWAQTADGKIGAKGSKPQERLLISNALTNRLVHQWRSEEAAILVGSGTALADDPLLTSREWPGKDALRLVIDRELKLPSTLHLLDGSLPTIVFNYQKKAQAGLLQYCSINKGEDELQQVLAILYRQRIQSVIVEGGAKLLQSFINAGLWDEARVITNTILEIGEGIEAPVLPATIINNTIQLQTDRIQIHTPKPAALF